MIGDFVSVVYDDGKTFNGEIVTIRKMNDGRTLFTVKDATVGYRSLYVEKCQKYTVTPKSN